MKDAKDVDRFDKWIAILQSRVPWKERILLPLTPSLSIVQKGTERIVKCRCGHEFGDYRDVKGIKIAHKRTSTSGGRVTSLDISKVELDPKIDPSMFAKPKK